MTMPARSLWNRKRSASVLMQGMFTLCPEVCRTSVADNLLDMLVSPEHLAV